MNGEPALRNLIGLFENIKDKGHKLIHHPWFEHTEFKKLCSTMVADLFHYGHVEYLKECKNTAPYLLVGIHSDEDVKTYKR